jgi:hypothetical protein
MRFPALPCYGNNISAVDSLDALLDPLSRCFGPESARRIVEQQIDPPIQARIELLAERANEGALDENERSEYEALINASDIISIINLKARRYLDSNIQ